MRAFLFALLMLTITSCQPSLNDVLCKQAWKFDGFDVSSELEEKLDSALDGNARKNLRKYLQSSLNKTETTWQFYPDGTCAQLANGQYKVGKWELGERTELLTINNRDSREVYRVESRDNELVLWLIGSKGDDLGQIAATLQQSDEYQNAKLNLLSPDRNTWRIKPTHPEMFKQIKKRLADQLTYMTDYFELCSGERAKIFQHYTSKCTFSVL